MQHAARITLRRFAGALCALLFVQTAAAEELTEDAEAIAALQACLASGDLPATCIGAAARHCAESHGRSGGVGICYGLEAEFWQARLDAAMVRLTPATAEAEAFSERVGWPDPTPSLAAVTDSFAAYRDATCDMAGALWGGGSGAGPAWMACRMRVTAEQALRLERWEGWQ